MPAILLAVLLIACGDDVDDAPMQSPDDADSAPDGTAAASDGAAGGSADVGSPNLDGANAPQGGQFDVGEERCALPWLERKALFDHVGAMWRDLASVIDGNGGSTTDTPRYAAALSLIYGPSHVDALGSPGGFCGDGSYPGQLACRSDLVPHGGETMPLLDELEECVETACAGPDVFEQVIFYAEVGRTDVDDRHPLDYAVELRPSRDPAAPSTTATVMYDPNPIVRFTHEEQAGGTRLTTAQLDFAVSIALESGESIDMRHSGSFELTRGPDGTPKATLTLGFPGTHAGAPPVAVRIAQEAEGVEGSVLLDGAPFATLEGFGFVPIAGCEL